MFVKNRNCSKDNRGKFWMPLDLSDSSVNALAVEPNPVLLETDDYLSAWKESLRETRNHTVV